MLVYFYSQSSGWMDINNSCEGDNKNYKLPLVYLTFTNNIGNAVNIK